MQTLSTCSNLGPQCERPFGGGGGGGRRGGGVIPLKVSSTKSTINSMLLSLLCVDPLRH